MISIAQIVILTILSLVLLLHFAILFKLLPYHMVWGGRLKSEKEMVRFEIVSIVTNLLFVVLVLLHANIMSLGLPRQVIIAGLWIMTGLFLLNTIGNILSKNKFEKRLFTPVTILLSICSGMLAAAN